MKKNGYILVVHPADKSTDFLYPIYENLKNKKVIRGGITKDELKNIVKDASRCIFMGHGTPMGLMSVGQFKGDIRGYIIDDSFAPILKDKECIFIWCHANRFVEKHQLKGFSTSMFCSEYSECHYEGVRYVKKGQVEESNDAFASIVGSHINSSIKTLHKSVIREYGVLAEVNPVAAYNNSRLLLF